MIEDKQQRWAREADVYNRATANPGQRLTIVLDAWFKDHVDQSLCESIAMYDQNDRIAVALIFSLTHEFIGKGGYIASNAYQAWEQLPQGHRRLVAKYANPVRREKLERTRSALTQLRNQADEIQSKIEHNQGDDPRNLRQAIEYSEHVARIAPKHREDIIYHTVQELIAAEGLSSGV